MAELKHLTPEEKLHKKLDNIEFSGMERTKEWASMWQESLRYFFSDQLHNKIQHKDWEWVIINYIWPSAIQEISKLTKNAREIVAVPTESDDTLMSEAWGGLLSWQWEKGLNKKGMRIAQIAAILDAQIFGYRVSKMFWQDKVEWDEEQQVWNGDVKYRLWHPAEFWASDDEFINDGNCGTMRFVDLEWAINQWPDFKKQLKDEAEQFTDTNGAFGFDNIRGQIGTSGTYPGAGTGGIDSGTRRVKPSKLLNLILRTDKLTSDERSDRAKTDRKVVKLSDMYIKDFEEEDEKIEQDVPQEELLATGQIVQADGNFFDAQTGEPMGPQNWPRRVVREFKKPKYPHGRNILRVGHTILNKDQQVWKYSKWPFVVTPHYLLPHMWQGIDGVQLYKTQQDMINISVSHLVNNMKQYGDRKILMERGAIDVPKGRDKEQFKVGKGAGRIIRLATGAISRNKIKFVEPANVPPAAAMLYGLFAQEFKNIQGLQDIARGIQKPGETTATESQMLAISSNDRIALQNIYEDDWVRENAGLMAEIMQNKYDPGRMVRILGQDGVPGIMQITQQMKNLRFDIDIIPTLVLPFDKERRVLNHEKAVQMIATNPTSPMLPDMLKLYEIRNWKKILEQTESWVLFQQFNQIFQQVAEGKLDPRIALQQLVQFATQKLEQVTEQQRQEDALEEQDKAKEEQNAPQK